MRRVRGGLRAPLVLVPLVLLLTACRTPPAPSSSPAVTVFVGSAASGFALGPFSSTNDRAGWNRAGTEIAILTHGSSSCPNEPATIRFPSPTRIAITFKPSPSGPCSLDLSSTIAVIRAAALLSRSEPLTVDLGYLGRATVPAYRP